MPAPTRKQKRRSRRSGTPCPAEAQHVVTPDPSIGIVRPHSLLPCAVCEVSDDLAMIPYDPDAPLGPDGMQPHGAIPVTPEALADPEWDMNQEDGVQITFWRREWYTFQDAEGNDVDYPVWYRVSGKVGDLTTVVGD